MKAYIGAKIIQAEPGKNANGVDGYIVIYPDGYKSWSPTDTFESAYREISRAEGELVTFVEADEPELVGDPEDCIHDFVDYNANVDDHRCRCGKYKLEFERENREVNP